MVVGARCLAGVKLCRRLNSRYGIGVILSNFMEVTITIITNSIFHKSFHTNWLAHFLLSLLLIEFC